MERSDPGESELKKRTTSWLHDLFGTDASGRSLLHRIVVLGNARGKQHGPTTATLREDYLSSCDIRIFVDGEDISYNEPELAKLATQLTEAYIPRKNPLEGQSKHSSNDATAWSVPETTSS